MIAAALLVAVAPVASNAAFAACMVCDEVVELDNRLAGCFRQDYQQILSTIQAAKSGNGQVDFSRCTGSDGSEKRAIDEMPTLLSGRKPDGNTAAAGTGRRLRTAYILDEAGIVCLRRLLDVRENPLKDVAQFDLLEECKP